MEICVGEIGDRVVCDGTIGDGVLGDWATGDGLPKRYEHYIKNIVKKNIVKKIISSEIKYKTF